MSGKLAAQKLPPVPGVSICLACEWSETSTERRQAALRHNRATAHPTVSARDRDRDRRRNSG